MIHPVNHELIKKCNLFLEAHFDALASILFPEICLLLSSTNEHLDHFSSLRICQLSVHAVVWPVSDLFMDFFNATNFTAEIGFCCTRLWTLVSFGVLIFLRLCMSKKHLNRILLIPVYRNWVQMFVWPVHALQVFRLMHQIA